MMRIRAAVAAGLLSVLVAAAAAAQTPPPATAPAAPRASADAAYLAKDYARAAVAFAAVVAADPTDAVAWYRLGVSHEMLGKLPEARKDFNEALARGFQAYSVHVRLAQVAVRGGDTAGAIKELGTATTLVPTEPADLEGDPEFASLRGNPAFVAVLDASRRALHPCREDAAYHALDFWVGDWIVRDKSGNELGRSHVESILDTCVVFENWTGGLGGSGKSFSFYDAATKQWTQHWVTAAGTHSDYVGAAQGSAIVMIAQGTAPNGKPQQTRLSFTPLSDGRVRQLFESSADGGATWMAGFDGYYTRR